MRERKQHTRPRRTVPPRPRGRARAKRLSLATLVIAAAVIGAPCARAGSDGAPVVEAATPNTAETPATRIDVDQDTNVIRFYVGGELAAQLDSGGFHVRKDVRFGGVEADTGEAGFIDHTKANGSPCGSGDHV